MTLSQIAVFVGIAAAVIATQIGRREVSIRRFLIPLGVAGFVAYAYLHSVPTIGGDLDFELLATAAGAALGIIAASLVRVERDGSTGKLVTQAGLPYAAVCVLVFGGRLAFAWLATGSWRTEVGQFSMAHAITGASAWTAAFVLMAVAMVLARTAVLGGRVALASSRDGATSLRPSRKYTISSSGSGSLLVWEGTHSRVNRRGSAPRRIRRLKSGISQNGEL